MTYSSFSVKVPGKLMIAGEYAILEPNQKAVVVAVDRYVTANIKPSNQNRLSLTKLGLEDLTWEIDEDRVRFNATDSRLNFIQSSISVVNQFLKEKSVTLIPFELQVESELDDAVTGKKYGLGSSAAVVTAVISAILHLHKDEIEPLTPDLIFKLSVIAHLKTQGSGSGADIAAAVYGGWIEYSAFNAKWVLKELKKDKKLSSIIENSWPNLSIKSLNPPQRLKMAIGWTKEPALTAPMINSVQNFRDRSHEEYNEFLNESSATVARLVKSFEINDCDEAIRGLTQNRNALKKLGENAGIDIETVKLKTLCSIAETYGSGKSSGAGGGDCGIAFLNGEYQVQELYKEWEAADIRPLNLMVTTIGILITEHDREILQEKNSTIEVTE